MRSTLFDWYDVDEELPDEDVEVLAYDGDRFCVATFSYGYKGNPVWSYYIYGEGHGDCEAIKKWAYLPEWKFLPEE